MQDQSDKATIVSLLPFDIVEFKAGHYPSYYTIAPAPKDGLSVTVIGQGCHYLELGLDRPPQQVWKSAYIVAQAVVNDYNFAQIGLADGAEPGLFALRGALTVEEVIERHSKELENARARQQNWYVNLVRLADDDWGRHRQHRSISDLQRFAARQLNMNREWAVDYQDAKEQFQDCMYCTSRIKSQAIVCPVCRNILKPDLYASMNPMLKAALADAKDMDILGVGDDSK